MAWPCTRKTTLTRTTSPTRSKLKATTDKSNKVSSTTIATPSRAKPHFDSTKIQISTRHRCRTSHKMMTSTPRSSTRRYRCRQCRWSMRKSILQHKLTINLGPWPNRKLRKYPYRWDNFWKDRRKPKESIWASCQPRVSRMIAPISQLGDTTPLRWTSPSRAIWTEESATPSKSMWFSTTCQFRSTKTDWPWTAQSKSTITPAKTYQSRKHQSTATTYLSKNHQ